MNPHIKRMVENKKAWEATLKSTNKEILRVQNELGELLMEQMHQKRFLSLAVEELTKYISEHILTSYHHTNCHICGTKLKCGTCAGEPFFICPYCGYEGSEDR